MADYAYVLKPGGMIYTCTDVPDLHLWMVGHLADCPLFERVPDAEMERDPVVLATKTSTEEGKKVERNHGSKDWSVWRRKQDPPYNQQD